MGYESRMTDNPAAMDPRKLDTLRAIMKALRTPVTGCPWDLQQTFATIAPYTIEEAYEVADAISRRSDTDLCEELGDLLLQVVFHARMAEEASTFAFDDVVEAICTKMIRRHPHVFGDGATANSPEKAKLSWEDAKARERKSRSGQGVLDAVPPALPGLTRAIKLQAAAARVGFDWPHVSYVFEKISEEMAELRTAERTSAKAEEFGDLLFAMANLARHLHIDPEASLREANWKFQRRFAHIERRLAEMGKKAEDSTLAEMDRLWDEAKELEASAAGETTRRPAG